MNTTLYLVICASAFHWLGWCSGTGEDSWHLHETRWGDAQSYPEGGLVGAALDRLEVLR